MRSFHSHSSKTIEGTRSSARVPAAGMLALGVMTSGIAMSTLPSLTGAALADDAALLAQNSTQNPAAGPIVRILQPSYADLLRGSVPVTIAVEATRYAPQTVEMFVDGRSATGGAVPLEAQPSAAFNWDTALFSDGPHRLTVRVTDTQGFIGQAEVMTYVNNGKKLDAPPPALTWLGLAQGQVLRGAANIQLDALGDFGVKYIFVSINPAATPQRKPALRQYLLNRPPYLFPFDTSKVPDGMYVLDALAWDALEQEGRAPTLTFGVLNNPINPTWSPPWMDELKKIRVAAQTTGATKPLAGGPQANSTRHAPPVVETLPAMTGASGGKGTHLAEGPRGNVTPRQGTRVVPPPAEAMTQMPIPLPKPQPERSGMGVSHSKTASGVGRPGAKIQPPRVSLPKTARSNSPARVASGPVRVSQRAMSVFSSTAKSTPAVSEGIGAGRKAFSRSNPLRFGRVEAAPRSTGIDTPAEHPDVLEAKRMTPVSPHHGEALSAPSAQQPAISHVVPPAVLRGTSPELSMLPPRPSESNTRAAAITVAPLGNKRSVDGAALPMVFVTSRDETLASIATRHKISAKLLAVINKMKPGQRIVKGTRVYLPRPLLVSFGGKPVTGDVASMMVGSTGVTPFRFLFEAQGGNVQWDGANRRVIARDATREVTLTIGSREVVVNQQQVMMDLAAFLLSGRTMVPVRFFEKALHAQVEWEPSTGRLYVAMSNED
jgi:Copper amine oxidase N-terminal domain